MTVYAICLPLSRSLHCGHPAKQTMLTSGAHGRLRVACLHGPFPDAPPQRRPCDAGTLSTAGLAYPAGYVGTNGLSGSAGGVIYDAGIGGGFGGNFTMGTTKSMMAKFDMTDGAGSTRAAIALVPLAMLGAAALLL